MLLSSALHGATDRRIVSSLLSHGALSNKQLNLLTRLAKSTISEHLDKLVVSGIVITRQMKNGIAYSLKDPRKVSFLLYAQGGNILDKASDRFIELWDF
jgi:DNA-binding transcriptional ArsR family regulator